MAPFLSAFLRTQFASTTHHPDTLSCSLHHSLSLSLSPSLSLSLSHSTVRAEVPEKIFDPDILMLVASCEPRCGPGSVAWRAGMASACERLLQGD